MMNRADNPNITHPRHDRQARFSAMNSERRRLSPRFLASAYVQDNDQSTTTTSVSGSVDNSSNRFFDLPSLASITTYSNTSCSSPTWRRDNTSARRLSSMLSSYSSLDTMHKHDVQPAVAAPTATVKHGCGSDKMEHLPFRQEHIVKDHRLAYPYWQSLPHVSSSSSSFSAVSYCSSSGPSTTQFSVSTTSSSATSLQRHCATQRLMDHIPRPPSVMEDYDDDDGDEGGEEKAQSCDEAIEIYYNEDAPEDGSKKEALRVKAEQKQSEAVDDNSTADNFARFHQESKNDEESSVFEVFAGPSQSDRNHVDDRADYYASVKRNRRHRRKFWACCSLCILLVFTSTIVTGVFFLRWSQEREAAQGALNESHVPIEDLETAPLDLCPLQIETLATGGIGGFSRPRLVPQISNRVDEDPFSWGVIWVEKEAPAYDDEIATPTRLDASNENNEAEKAKLMLRWQQELLVELQSRIAPFFSGSFETDSIVKLCFPFTLKQRESLFWLVEQITRDFLSTGMDVEEQLISNGETMTPSPLMATLSEFDDDNWLQVYLVGFLILSWNISDDDNSQIIDMAKRNSAGNPLVSTSHSPLNLCGWKGVGCTGNGRLRSLDWGHPNLSLDGTIPTELAMLSHLALLDLSHSPRLVGRVPMSLDSIRLKALYLEETMLSGIALPRNIAHGASSLTDLRITGSRRLDFPVEKEFWNRFRDLKWLEWSRGLFVDDDDSIISSKLPSAIGLLTNVEGLSLSGNLFTGTVPTELSQLTLLETLDLSHNKLSEGGLPKDIGKLLKLEWLAIEHNSMRGSLPLELVTDLTKLKWLSLGGNDFDRLSLLAVLQGTPLDCNCGAWTQSSGSAWVNGRVEESSSKYTSRLPDSCFCSVSEI